jgi:hypothetical protein
MWSLGFSLLKDLQGVKNQMIFFFGIRLRWPPDSPLLKKKTLFEKRKIGWHLILLTTHVKEKKGSTLNYERPHGGH